MRCCILHRWTRVTLYFSSINRLRARGFAEAQLARLVSPIGLFEGGKHPAEVAVSALAQVLQHAASAAAEPADVHDRLRLPG